MDLYRRHFSPSVLVNRLGTTETFSFRFYFMDQESQLSGNIVPAGYTVSDKEVFLLNEEGNVVKCGEVGEIAVHSHFLALGYWRKPELTGQSLSPIHPTALAEPISPAILAAFARMAALSI